MDGSCRTQQSNTDYNPRIHNSPNSLILLGRCNIYDVNTIQNTTGQDTTTCQQSQHQSQLQPQPQSPSQSPSATKDRKYLNANQRIEIEYLPKKK